MMNWIQNIQFEVTLNRAPELTFSATKVTIPGLSGQPPQQPSPFKNIPLIIDHVEYSDLSITALVDEDMKVWESMYTWMLMGTPSSFDEFDDSKIRDTHYDDISVIAYNSKKNPILRFNYFDCVPISITEILLDTQQTDVRPIDFTANFQFRKFSIERIR